MVSSANRANSQSEVLIQRNASKSNRTLSTMIFHLQITHYTLVSSLKVGGPFDTRIIWKRPSEFLTGAVEKIEVFSKTVDPTDIERGSAWRFMVHIFSSISL